MLKIHTEIIIDAPFERVRELLADTALYPQWHPLFPQITGEMRAGAQIEVTVALPEIKSFKVQATIREYTAGSCLCWRYSYRLPGLFAWTYRYELQALNSAQLNFTQHSSFTGLLAPLYHLGMRNQLQQGLIELNRAVQRWGERRGLSCPKC